MANFQPQSSLPTSSLEISVACKKLTDKDVMSKSDPLCVMYVQQGGSASWHEVGRTESVLNNLNPVWQKKFHVEYRFEERQMVKFEVYDKDKESEKLKKHDFLGKLETSLGSIVSAPGKQFVSIMKEGPSKGGQFIIMAEELVANKSEMHIQLGAKGLDKKDTFGKSDPYFVLSKITGHGQYSQVYKSETIDNTLNPNWKPFSVKINALCNGDYNRELKIDIFDWDKNGKHDLIGSFSTNLNALSGALKAATLFNCINPKKQSKKNYKNSGQAFVKSFSIETNASFLDFIQGGTAMNFSVAVDFTASNGNPNDPRSLHFRQPGIDNQYSTAIRAVGDIIQDYDSDKHFPALGFGGKIPPHGQVSHEFFLNLRPDTPYCTGVEGILEAYYTSLQHVVLHGPTNFSPVIKHVAQFANAFQDGRQYFVLLIITDGIITDMDKTKEAIVEASVLPMSLIIVGVGDEDFSSMEALDCDRGVLQIGGKRAKRDIVQFVELRKYLSKDRMWNKEMLAKSVLAEVPKQVVGWMKMRGVKPLNA